MVTNAPNFGTHAVVIPVVSVLLGMSQTISLLNGMDFSLVKDLETDRRSVVAALLKNIEALGKLANRWELEAVKKLAGECN